MSLSSALSTAMAGLRANQAALSIVSSNVANAQTPGYVAQSVNQIELAGGAGMRQRPRHRRQPPARSIYPGAVAHRELRRRLCRPDRQYPEPVAKRLRHARRGRHAGNRLQQFHLRGAGAVGKLRLDRGAIFGAVARRSRWRSSSTRPPRHPDAALQCRAGHRRLGRAGQCRRCTRSRNSIRGCKA